MPMCRSCPAKRAAAPNTFCCRGALQSYVAKMQGKMELLFYGKDAAASKAERRVKSLFDMVCAG